MAKKDFTPVISKELQDTVRANENIKNVYFDDKNNHHFHKHKITVHEVGDDGFSKKATEVEALPGAKLGVAKVIDARKQVKDKRVNVSYKAIAAEMTREEILEAEPTAKSRTEKEKMEILAAAAEISRGEDFASLMAKLNPSKGKGKGKSEDENA